MVTIGFVIAIIYLLGKDSPLPPVQRISVFGIARAFTDFFKNIGRAHAACVLGVRVCVRKFFARDVAEHWTVFTSLLVQPG